MTESGELPERAGERLVGRTSAALSSMAIGITLAILWIAGVIRYWDWLGAADAGTGFGITFLLAPLALLYGGVSGFAGAWAYYPRQSTLWAASLYAMRWTLLGLGVASVWAVWISRSYLLEGP